MYNQVPITPKNGVAKVLIIARISTIHQDVQSLDAQVEKCKKHFIDQFGPRAEFLVIQSQGSGERLDTAALSEAETLIEGGTIDVVIAEDLGRIMRRARAIDFCELCEDQNTRLIAINDAVDTAEKKWRRNALWAAMKHEEANEDTSDRLKRQMDHNFSVSRGCCNHVVWGIEKTPGCKNDDGFKWNPLARKLIRAAVWKFERHPERNNITRVARWMRERSGISIDGKKLGRLLRDPILTGVRRRGMRRSRRLNRTGERRGLPAPADQILTRYCPHLQIIHPRRFERLNLLLAQRNAVFKRGADCVDPCKGRPKRKTKFPGQMMTCGIRGRYFCWGGHGQEDHLMCAGCREYRCWNTASVNGPLAAKRIAAAVVDKIMSLEDFDSQFRQKVIEKAAKPNDSRTRLISEIDAAERQADKEIAHIQEAVRVSGANPIFIEEANRLGKQKKEIEFRQQELARMPVRNVVIPPVQQVREQVRGAFERLLQECEDVPILIRNLVPRIELFPVQMCDGGPIVQRALVQIHLASLVPGLEDMQCSSSKLRWNVHVDLFIPPQREMFRMEVETALQRRPAPTYKEIATELSAKNGYVTDTAVQRSAALIRLMERMGWTDPYLSVVRPPEDNGRSKMHRHPDYRFDPLEGFPHTLPVI